MMNPLILLLPGCMDYDMAPVDVDPAEVTTCGFTQDPSIPELWAYDCNPVFPDTSETWYDTIDETTFSSVEVLGHPFYQVWYSAEQDDTFGVGYAVSDNGIDWVSNPDNPGWPARSETDWDNDTIHCMRVVWDPQRQAFVMLYHGTTVGRDVFGTGVAASRDGMVWALSPLNPVISEEVPVDGVGYSWPLTLSISDKGIYSAYLGGEWYAEGTRRQDIYRMETIDPEVWDGGATLVLSFDVPGAWETHGVVAADVAELDGRLYLFYIGIRDIVDHDTYWSVNKTGVGLATSDDGGVTWTRVTTEAPFSNWTDAVDTIAVRAIGSRIHLWVTDAYEGVGTAIGYFLYEP